MSVAALSIKLYLLLLFYFFKQPVSLLMIYGTEKIGLAPSAQLKTAIKASRHKSVDRKKSGVCYGVD